jgi:hypothetical protein
MVVIVRNNAEAELCFFVCFYMPLPLPYFKVNICLFPLPHFASIFFAYLWSFRWPNYIVTLPRYFSFRLPHLNIPPQTNWTRIFSERRLVYFSDIETDTATSGLCWIFQNIVESGVEHHNTNPQKYINPSPHFIFT